MAMIRHASHYIRISTICGQANGPVSHPVYAFARTPTVASSRRSRNPQSLLSLPRWFSCANKAAQKSRASASPRVRRPLTWEEIAIREQVARVEQQEDDIARKNTKLSILYADLEVAEQLPRLGAAAREGKRSGVANIFDVKQMEAATRSAEEFGDALRDWHTARSRGARLVITAPLTHVGIKPRLMRIVSAILGSPVYLFLPFFGPFVRRHLREHIDMLKEDEKRKGD